MRRAATFTALWCGAVVLLPLGMLGLLVLCLMGHTRAMPSLQALDFCLNAMTGGSNTETLSHRARRARDAGRGWGCTLCRLLHLVDRDHCDKVKR